MGSILFPSLPTKADDYLIAPVSDGEGGVCFVFAVITHVVPPNMIYASWGDVWGYPVVAGAGSLSALRSIFRPEIKRLVGIRYDTLDEAVEAACRYLK